MRRTFFYTLLVTGWLAASPEPCAAQRPARISLTAGPGLGFVAALEHLDERYAPIATPRVSLRLEIPIGKRVAFMTGMGYEQEGFRTRVVFDFSPPNEEFTDVYSSRTRYHFLTVPLQAQVRLAERKGWTAWIGGGMSYGFLLRARPVWDYYSYEAGQLTSHSRYVSRPRIGLVPRDSRIPQSPGGRYSSLYLFQPAVAVSLKVAGGRRWSVQVFYERNLYNAEMEKGNSVLRLQAVGVMAGVGF